jgi:hypothetical protein
MKKISGLITPINRAVVRVLSKIKPLDKLSLEKKKKRLYISFAVLGSVVVATILYLVVNKEVSAKWWNDNWTYRQAVNITYSGSENLTEYQVLIDALDTATLVSAGKMQSDCDDIRFTNKDGEMLEYFIVGNTCNTSDTEIWVKADSIPGYDISLFMYYGNPSASSYQSEADTFSYSEEKIVGYNLFNDVNDLQIISLENGNSITHNSVTKTLDAYDPDSFTSISQYGAVTAKKLFNADDQDDNTDALVPVSWAGTEFTFYTRSTDIIFYALAPWQDATVDIYDQGSPTCSGSKSVTSSGTTINCTVTTGQIRISSDYPILLFSETNTGSYDQMPLRPSTTERIIGGSQNTYVTSNASGADYRYIRSTDSAEQNPANLGADASVAISAGTYGSSPSFLIYTADNPIVAHQQGDGDGSDSHMYQTLSEMGTKYGSAVSNTDYISLASDQAATCTVYDASDDSQIGQTTLSSTNTSIYWGGFGTGDSSTYTTADWYMICDAPVAAHYQKNNSAESGLWTYPMMRQFTYPTPTVSSMGSEETTPGPIAYWKFDEGTGQTANDTTVNHNDGQLGSTSGSDTNDPTWTPEDRCASGKCLSFDGSDDYITMGDNLDQNAKSFTLQAWIRPNDTSTVGQRIFVKDTVTQGWALTLGDPGANQIRFFTRETSTVSLDTGAIINANTWYHVAATYDVSSGTKRIYVNGKQVAEQTGLTGSIANNTAPLGIGADPDGSSGNKFQGFIDEAKIYPYARSADEIKADYNNYAHVLGIKSESFLTDGLVGYWKMDDPDVDTEGETITDSSGNGNTGTLYGNDGSGDNGSGMDCTSDGEFGTGCNFDGTDDYVSFADTTSLRFGEELTFAGWLKLDSSWSGYNEVIYRAGWGNGWDMVISPGNMDFRSSCLGSTDNYLSTGLTANNTWQFFVVTFSSTEGKIRTYKNGNLVTTKSQTGTLCTSAGTNKIGQGQGAFFGNMDEIRIYNRALSASEIKALYEWSPGPVANYAFDEGTGTGANSIKDTSGNSNHGDTNGSMTESDWVSGKFGGALDLDGNDDYISISDNTQNSPLYEFTLSAWVKFDSTGNDAVINKWIDRSGTSDRSFLIRKNATGEVLQAYLFQSNSIQVGGDFTTKSINPNTWYHITVTADGTKLNMYLDGAKSSTSYSYNGTVSDSSIDLEFGNYNTSGWELDGTIDEVRIYNYARTPQQIVEDMNAGHPAGGSPLGSQLLYYKFDRGYESTAYDSGIGGNNATISNATWTNSGKIGKALSFNGSSSYVKLNTSLLSDKEALTVSVWAKPTSLGDHDTIIGEFSPGVIFGMMANGRFKFYNGSNYYSTANPITTGEWQHLAYVFNGDSQTITFYRNGKYVEGISSVGSSLISSTVDTEIGARNNGANDQYQGVFDELKIYNSALTADQIVLDMNQGKSVVYGSTSTDSSGNPDNSASREYCVPGDSTSCSAPVAEWKLDEKNGTNAYDTSGSGNTGILGGDGSGTDIPSWYSGKQGGALKFDGNDDYVLVNSAVPSSPSQGSATLWFNRTWATNDSVAHGVFAIGEYDPPNHVDYKRLQIFKYSNNNWFFRLGGDSSFNQITKPDSEISGNEWHFVAMTWSGTTVNVYLDGASLGSFTQSPPTAWLNDKINIGRGYSNKYMQGLIDNIRIYDYARTPTQIAWDYNRGGPVGYWKFDECQGETIYDSSGNGNNGTWSGSGGTQTSVGTCTTSGTAWGNGATGKRNASLNFDGGDDWVDIGANTITGTKPYTLSAWVKGNSPSGHDGAMGIGNGATNQLAWIGWVGTAQQGTSNSWGGGGYGNNWGSGVTDTTNWHHLVLTSSGGSTQTFYIYVDGVQKFTTTASFNLASTSTKIGVLDDNGTPNYWFSGQIDDARIYNYALTSNQVKTLYSEGTVRFGPATGSP